MSIYSAGYAVANLYAKLRHVEFIGRENLVYDAPAVVIGNHSHWADPIYIGLAYPKRKVRFMAKAELFASRFSCFWLNKLGVFPVSRGNNDVKSLKTALTILKSGGVLGIFPEGTRDHEEDGGILEFKQGSVMLAIKGKAAIIPIGLKYADNLLRFSKPHPVVCIGEPICPSLSGFETKQEALDFWTEKCRLAIADLIK